MNAAGTESDFEIPARTSCRQSRYIQDSLDLNAAFPHQKELGCIDFVEDFPHTSHRYFSGVRGIYRQGCEVQLITFNTELFSEMRSHPLRSQSTQIGASPCVLVLSTWPPTCEKRHQTEIH